MNDAILTISISLIHVKLNFNKQYWGWSSKLKIIQLIQMLLFINKDISHLNNALSDILANTLKEPRKLSLSQVFLTAKHPVILDTHQIDL